MELRIRTIEEIKDIIYRENAKIMDFPVISDFTFPELYKEIVMINNTIDISTNCLLYNIIESKEKTEMYQKINKIIKNYWFIGEAGFDYWVMDKKGKIYYWERPKEETIDVNINFEQWLKFAYLDKDNDKILKKYEGFDPIVYEQGDKIEYNNKINEISKELGKFILELY